MHSRQVASSFPLSGIAYCAACGAALAAHKAKSGQYHYYGCSSRIKGRNCHCTQPLTRREVLENAMLAQTRTRLLSDENLAQLVEMVNEELAVVQAGNAGRTQSLDHEIDEVRRRLDRYYDSFERGVLDPSELGERVGELKDRLTTLQLERGRLDGPDAPKRIGVAEVRERAGRLKELLECADSDARKLALRSLIQRIDLEATP